MLILHDAPEDMNGMLVTQAGNCLFQINEERKEGLFCACCHAATLPQPVGLTQHLDSQIISVWQAAQTRQ